MKFIKLKRSWLEPIYIKSDKIVSLSIEQTQLKHAVYVVTVSSEYQSEEYTLKEAKKVLLMIREMIEVSEEKK